MKKTVTIALVSLATLLITVPFSFGGHHTSYRQSGANVFISGFANIAELDCYGDNNCIIRLSGFTSAGNCSAEDHGMVAVAIPPTATKIYSTALAAYMSNTPVSVKVNHDDFAWGTICNIHAIWLEK